MKKGRTRREDREVKPVTNGKKAARKIYIRISREEKENRETTLEKIKSTTVKNPYFTIFNFKKSQNILRSGVF